MSEKNYKGKETYLAGMYKNCVDFPFYSEEK